jgi:prepilin signal peptidase PulO-like enzyme (type II secretory pathway)
VDGVGALVGLGAGLLVGPLVDRIATNAPLHLPLLRSTPRSPRIVLVTAATALLGAASGLAFGLTVEGATAALFCWILVAVTRSDFEHRLIPDRIVLPGALVLLVLRTIEETSVEWAVSAAAAGLVLLVVVLVYPQGLGMGDVKLSALLGAALGYAVAIAVFIGFFVAFVPAALLLVLRGREARKAAIPLGPFLALGAVVTLFAGDEIWDWYRGLGR